MVIWYKWTYTFKSYIYSPFARSRNFFNMQKFKITMAKWSYMKPGCLCPFALLSSIIRYRLKTGTHLSWETEAFRASCLTCFQVKVSFISLAAAQSYYYIIGTNSCFCCVNHMNIAQSWFLPSHLILVHFLCNKLCSHKKANKKEIACQVL